jgi:DNA-binding NarL/FixJ family response regulator
MTDTSAPRRPLNKEELYVLSLLAAGLSTSTVARKRCVSSRTLRRQVSGIREAVGVSTTIEAVRWAARQQLI